MKNGNGRSLHQQFGGRLRKARLARGMTQHALAMAIGTHNMAISDMERGIHLPNFQKLRSLCLVLHQPADYLIVRRGR